MTDGSGLEIMSEPMLNDPATYATTTEGTQELECGYDECAHPMEVQTTEEYSHGDTTWYAEWTCAKCGQENTKEGWY